MPSSTIYIHDELPLKIAKVAKEEGHQQELLRYAGL